MIKEPSFQLIPKSRAHEMGEKASAMIIEEIEASAEHKPSPQHLVFSAVLVEREST